MQHTLLALVIAGAFICGGAAIAQAESEFESSMNRFIEEALDTVEIVPGFGICVVKDGQVIHIGGYGHRDVESRLPVTRNTGFYIASSTKSFTGMAASVLAARGDLDLEAPVSRYLPELKLPDPLSPDGISVRALLTHQSGIDNREVQRQLAFVRSLTKSEFLDMMLTQSKPMPTEFIYSNLGYNVIGYLLENLTGRTWKEVVSETVLGPVGMTSTTTSIETASSGDFAWPYAASGNSFERVEVKSDDIMHAAGGLVTTPSDLARWLIVNLNGGVIDGREVLDAKAVRAAHESYATTDRRYDRFQRTGYGLGWYHSDFEGERLMHHFGGFNGYHAHVSFMPEHGVGVATLMNTDSHRTSGLAHLVAAYAYERLLERPDVDARFEEEVVGYAARAAGTKQYRERVEHARVQLAAGESEGARAQLVGALRSAEALGISNEGSVNRLGYSLLEQESCEAAIAVFGFNVEIRSESPNVHDSLGEAYETCDRIHEARESYATACAMAAAQGGDNLKVFEANLERVTALANRSR